MRDRSAGLTAILAIMIAVLVTLAAVVFGQAQKPNDPTTSSAQGATTRVDSDTSKPQRVTAPKAAPLNQTAERVRQHLAARPNQERDRDTGYSREGANIVQQLREFSKLKTDDAKGVAIQRIVGHGLVMVIHDARAEDEVRLAETVELVQSVLYDLSMR